MLWILPDIPVADLVSTNFYMNYNPEVADSDTLLLVVRYDPNNGSWSVEYKHPDYQGRLQSAGTEHQDIGFTLQGLTLQQDPGNYTCVHSIFGEDAQWGIFMLLFIYGEYIVCGD